MKEILFYMLIAIFSYSVVLPQWEVFNTENSELQSNEITDIVVDLDNNIWIGTDNGLIKLNNGKWIIYDNSNSPLTNSQISDIFLDYKGNIWILNEENIIKYSNQNFEIIDSIFHGQKIVIDYNDNIWLAKNRSLYKYEGEKWIEFYTDSTPNATYIEKFIIDKNNDKWFTRVNERGVRKIDNEDILHFTIENSGLIDDYIFDIAVDSNNNIWFGATDIIQKYSIENDNWKYYNHENSPISTGANEIWNIEFDYENSLWFTTSRGISAPRYLYNFEDESWKKYKLDTLFNKSFPHSPLTALSASLNGNIWVGTITIGLIKYTQNPKSVEQLPVGNTKIYPNPATKSLNIELDEKYSISEYRIIDLKGVELMQNSGQFTTKQSIDIDSLPQGVYIIEIITNSGDLVREKFVKY